MTTPILYELAVLGEPSDAQVAELREAVSRIVEAFGLRLGREVSWLVRPGNFRPSQQRAAAVVIFGGKSVAEANLRVLLATAVPMLPVVSDLKKIRDEVPEVLQSLNCLNYSSGGMSELAVRMLECASLLPRQRRVFLSYRRDEARAAALQLFDAFSARLFDVFLDTHGIAPGEDFQATLWHRLCDSDVLVMLDTPQYFDSRWTSAEFGRALAKGISVLRVGWPDATPSRRTATASRVELVATEVDAATGRLDDEAVGRVCVQLEMVRSQSCAVRMLNVVSGLRHAVESIGGQVVGIGVGKSVHVRLADDRNVVMFPTIGVPTSITLHSATRDAPDCSVAVVYDPVGLHPAWLAHLEWLGEHIRAARWIKATEAAWQLAAWDPSR